MTAEALIKELGKFAPSLPVYYTSRDEEPSEIDKVYQDVLYQHPETRQTVAGEPDDQHPDPIKAIVLEYI